MVMAKPASIKTLWWNWIAELSLALAAVRFLIFTSLHLVSTLLGLEQAWIVLASEPQEWCCMQSPESGRTARGEGIPRRDAVQWWKFPEQRARKGGHRASGTGPWSCKRGFCRLGHPASKSAVAQWMAHVWSVWKQALLKPPRPSGALKEGVKAYQAPLNCSEQNLSSTGTSVSLWVS